MKLRMNRFAIVFSLLISASPAFSDVIIDPDNTGATRVYPQSISGLINNTDRIYLGHYETIFGGPDGALEVNSNNFINGYTALNGTAITLGKLGGDGPSGILRIIGNGSTGSARIDLEGDRDTSELRKGLLEFRNGGVLENRGSDMHVGHYSGNVTVNIDGTGSIFRNMEVEGSFAGSRIVVGFQTDSNSQSTINITNGGLMEAMGGILSWGGNGVVLIGSSGGSGSTATVNVVGEDSTLRTGGNITVAADNIEQHANLNIASGGRAESPEVYVGALTGAADIKVSGFSSSGEASTVIANDIQVGGSLGLSGYTSTGIPKLDYDTDSIVEGQQVADSEGNLLFKENGDPVLGAVMTWEGFSFLVPETFLDGNHIIMKTTGSLLVENGAQVVAQNIQVSENETGPAPTFNGQSSIMTVRNGASVTADVYVNQDGVLNGDGTINGNVFVQGGTVAPGNSPGTMTINGDFIFTTGFLELEADSPLEKDLLAVSGDVFIGSDTVFNIVLGFDIGGVLDITSFFFDVEGSFTVDSGFDGMDNIHLMFTADSGLMTGDIIDVRLGDSLFSIAGIGAISSVPEPSTMLLFGAGLIGFAFRRLRKTEMTA